MVNFEFAEQDARQIQRQKRKNISIRISEVSVLLFFIASIVFEIPEFEGLLTYAKVFGILFAIIGFHNVQFNPLRNVAKTVILFQLAFLGWLFLTGFFVAHNLEFFWNMYRSVLQGVSICFGISTYVLMKRKADLVFISYCVVTLILGYYSYSLGELSISTLFKEGRRATSILSNPNYLGVVSVYGVFCVVYLWERVPRWGKPALAALMAADVTLIVISASRKAFVALILFSFLYTLLGTGFQSGKTKMRIILGIIVLSIGLSFSMDYIREETHLGRRWEKLETEDDLGEGRESLISEAWDFVLESPIIGIGLSNFRVISQGQAVTHSDYMEVMVSSGFIGILLYMIPYFIVLSRIRHLRRTTTNTDEKKTLGLFLAILITVLFNGGSFMNFISYAHWIMFAGIVGYLEMIEGNLRPLLSGPPKRVPPPRVNPLSRPL